MLEFIQENLSMVYELIALFILLFISVHIEKKAKRSTRIVIILLLITSIVFHVEKWTGDLPELTIARPLLTATSYSLYPIILIFLMNVITDTTKYPLMWRLLTFIPLVILLPLFYTSQWTHIVCYFTEGNHYQGGPLSWLPYFAFGYYLVMFIVLNIIQLNRYSFNNKMIILFITVFPAIGVFLYVILELSGNYSVIFTSSILIYYLFTYIHNARIDNLTGLLNRAAYYQVMNSPLSKIGAVISVDMNELKYLNDEYGHSAGDEALVTVAHVLVDNKGEHSEAYRIGGDEFIIFYYIYDENIIKEKMEFLRQKMAETKYSCAFGYAMRGDLNVEDTIKLADSHMYADKERIKGQCNCGKEIHMRD